MPKTAPVTRHPSPVTELDLAIERAVGWLLARQAPDGYWWGELESNVTITAEHVFLTHVLGVGGEGRWEQIARYILEKQRDDGSWANWHGGPGDLSTTIEAYLALKLAGVSPDDPRLGRARDWILAHGGVEKSRVFTKIWLALLGEWPWDATPMLPPELVLLPQWFPVSIYAFASWARATIVPLAILRAVRPVYPLPDRARLDDLFPRGRENADHRLPRKGGAWGRLFCALDRALRVYERRPVRFLRRRALQAAEEWILARQEADGCWGGIQPPWVYSLIALHALGHPVGSPVLAKGLAGFDRYGVEEDGTWRLQSCISPVWDTGLAAMALEDAGLPADHPALVRAGTWLLGEQILVGGDWQANCRARPGGWSFEFDNDAYPDTDDTSVVLMALRGTALPEEDREFALGRGLEWLLGMQSRNGGWGAFDRNNTGAFLREIPFADFGEVIDPPSADVTAHIVELLGRLGYRPGFRPLDRALRYLWKEQEPDGSWYGRWGVNHVYGTGAVLPALAACGWDMTEPRVRRAVEFLVSRQNDDGGWGEAVESYHRAELRGRGASTPSQTAWALLALLAAGEGTGEAARRGIAYLVATQRDDGTWDEPQFTGTGFPTDFMIRYHLYRHVFPVMALGRARKGVTGDG
jgi:squalene-hopene/tetraprenyl-beta-curcumene cyclase